MEAATLNTSAALGVKRPVCSKAPIQARRFLAQLLFAAHSLPMLSYGEPPCEQIEREAVDHSARDLGAAATVGTIDVMQRSARAGTGTSRQYDAGCQ